MKKNFFNYKAYNYKSLKKFHLTFSKNKPNFSVILFLNLASIFLFQFYK